MGIEKIVDLSCLRDVDNDGDLLKWIRNFDSHFYRTHGHFDGFADLENLSDSELLLHFISTGHAERRSYNQFLYSFIDPVFYRERYRELRLGDDADAVRHWMYFGAYEGRSPNEPTQRLIDADVHLFQMGRVGSKSIEAALYASGHDRLVPHLHWKNEILYTYPDSFYGYEELVKLGNGRKIFISGVRNPIDRLVSGLFNSALEAKSTVSVEFLFSLLKRPQFELDYFIEPHLTRILDWFDHQYFLSIDVFAQPFDIDAGYTVIEAPNATVLLYRFDRLDEIWPRISDVTGRELPRVHVNEGGRTGLRPQIEAFRDRLRLGEELRERIAQSRYTRHFFADLKQ
jgi:hypothetical protein